MSRECPTGGGGSRACHKVNKSYHIYIENILKYLIYSFSVEKKAICPGNVHLQVEVVEAVLAIRLIFLIVKIVNCYVQCVFF